jgi:N-acetylmuramoyl-L-alanine amidase
MSNSVVKRFEAHGGSDEGELGSKWNDTFKSPAEEVASPLRDAYQGYKDYKVTLSKDSSVDVSLKDKKITYKRSF